MKIEMDHNTSGVLTVIAVGAAIVTVILGIAYFVHDYNVKQNAALATAKSCEELVVLQGGSDMTNRLIACKLQPQPVTPVNQSGK